jgi:hypothetical protein
MPTAEVTFISANWVNNLTPEQQTICYSEIVDYFTNEVLKEVLSKYDKSLDFSP